MGWANDFPFDHIKDTQKKKIQIATYDKVLHFIKAHPDCSVADVRKFINNEKKA